jgi:hypothetical protein
VSGRRRRDPVRSQGLPKRANLTPWAHLSGRLAAKGGAGGGLQERTGEAGGQIDGTGRTPEALGGEPQAGCAGQRPGLGAR